MTRVNLGSAILQIAASVLWVPQAALIATAIGSVATGNGPDVGAWAAAGVLVVGIVRAIVDGVGNRLAFRAARSAVTGLRSKAIAALAARSPLDIGRPESGRAASIIAEQAEAVVPYIARFEAVRLRATIVPAVLFIAILSLSWAAALVLLIAAPLIPIFMALIGWRAQAASEAQLAKSGDMNAFLLDRLRGMATIRTLDAVDATARRLRANAEDLRARTMAVLRIAFLSSAVLELFSALGVAMVAVYIGFHLLGQLPFGTWGGPLDLAQGLFILLLAPAFFEPLRDLSAVWHDRASGRAAIEALEGLASGGKSLIASDHQETRKPTIWQAPARVTIENLDFRYDESLPLVLDGFNLSVAPGERVALVGSSGSGKSTLLALLAGLARPTRGSISIAGRQLTDETIADLRDGIAWIGQHPHIFAGTLASNVALGRPVGRANIVKALKFSKLDELVQTRGPDAIGENGVGISGGEALRLALARVMVRPQARLILADEPTAHLDSATANDIAESLLTLASNKTVIIATHDLALAKRMDRIVRLGDWPLERAA
ncbi:MAG: thiol reductant ABC exporter subunit CydD [Hyphomicrobium sp.]|uniref:thiol reductant ABC exporter subunit CydD n=1 Tax=Hyphomicrobium sp. TaxID=82 RepID=UPI0039E65B0F